jgi:hypothetical protein
MHDPLRCCGQFKHAFLENRGVGLKWEKKSDAGTKGAMKIRESFIHFLTKPSSMLRWLETTAGLGCILKRIDLCPQAQPL